MRKQRTTKSFIEAYLALLHESPRVPTAKEIAERAGTSLRTIFDHFADLRALSLAATDYTVAFGKSETVILDVSGDRWTRIRSHVTARAHTCERWFPLWRVVIANQVELAELKNRVDQERLATLDGLKVIYRPELSTLSTSEHQKILIALETLVDVESWGRMRERHGLSTEAARDVWIAAIDRILPSTPLASTYGSPCVVIAETSSEGHTYR